MTIRLIIIDDHELLRDALALYVNVQPGIEVVAEAANAEELLQKLRTISADLLLLDIAMPGLSGLDVIPIIKSLYPDLPILMLSAHGELQMVRSAMQAGASDFICKTSSPATLLEAIKEVMVIGKFLTQDMAEKLLLAPASRPYDDEITDLCGVVRLNGKSIKEWREDCLTFYQKKAKQEDINTELDSKNITIENENFCLAEKVRHIDEALAENTPDRRSYNCLESDCQRCRTREVGSSGLVECKVEMASCKYAVPFAKKYFCRHPSGL